ncbi:MAG: hypothetical protein LBS71_01015 [Puniceicoccales bacterium]|jgi:ABC-type transport system involved in multi-copper enzyme maturation permease subunit|nr:hypothetical protein [Puniceicoccales bacterium]
MMRKFRILIGHELQQYYFSSFGYAISALFLFLMGIVFFISLKVYADFPQEEPLIMQLFKSMWLPLLFIVPTLTTKAIVAEKVDHLFDSLFLLPIPNYSIVCAKFFVIYLLYASLWTIVAFFPEIAQKNAASLANFNHLTKIYTRWGGWFFVNLVGGFVIAFGLLISSYAKTTATSMIATIVGIFLFLVSGQLFKHASAISLNQSEVFASLYDNWNVFFQLEDFCRGIFDTRVILFYLTFTAATLAITTITLRKN